jgi:hypothetical protein
VSKIRLLLVSTLVFGPVLLQTSAEANNANRPLVSARQFRTYVSGMGSDSNSCVASSPCQTFQGALAKTMPGGEIYVLDSANYGPVTITQAVTITSEGATGGVLATGSAGITISAGAQDVVTLRGLEIDGGNSGGTGILFTSGKSLNVQQSTVRNFVNSGISFASTASSWLVVSDSTLINNTNNGILASSGSGPVTVTLSRVTATGNGVGMLAHGVNTSMAITDATVTGNTYGIGATSAAVMVRNSTISDNSVGISAQESSIIRVGQSSVTANATGWQASGGQVLSYGNNNVNGNTSDGTPTTSVALN